jgi:6-pyruvoyltetrahydropterin/6-carboxytetrahydropterin synthase
MIEISKTFYFEAAHSLRDLGERHKCSRLHGHLFQVEVVVGGEIDEKLGWIMDFGDISRETNEVLERLDHKLLNDIEGLEVPTSENIARYIFSALKPKLRNLVAIVVSESPHSRCMFREAPEVMFKGILVSSPRHVFSSAHFLLFQDGSRETLHGHDYECVASMWVEAGRGFEARQALEEEVDKVCAGLNHHLLLPSEPVAGRIETLEDKIVLSLPQETVVFPSRDCLLLPVGNTTTEALSRFIASSVQAGISSGNIAFHALEISMKESSSCSCRHVVEAEP